MRVTILEKEYSSKYLYTRGNHISEHTINACIENLESQGYKVIGVQVVNYDNENMERVVITYD
ncbi:MAG: hypothetical protein EOM50_07080 [Erysipelotrichia bacterium]|nr:hypothetical protein [Erysipelotrichia bacterium]NCC55021.1 hypothetical protein [Erysipelotrichia bacterium]